MEKKQFVMLFKFRARHRQTDSEYTYVYEEQGQAV